MPNNVRELIANTIIAQQQQQQQQEQEYVMYINNKNKMKGKDYDHLMYTQHKTYQYRDYYASERKNSVDDEERRGMYMLCSLIFREK